MAMKGKSETARVTAACVILDRGYGKPKQQIEADLNGKITLEQLVLASMKVPAGRPEGKGGADNPHRSQSLRKCPAPS
jgi:hypothetical protein